MFQVHAFVYFSLDLMLRKRPFNRREKVFACVGCVLGARGGGVERMKEKKSSSVWEGHFHLMLSIKKSLNRCSLQGSRNKNNLTRYVGFKRGLLGGMG